MDWPGLCHLVSSHNTPESEPHQAGHKIHSKLCIAVSSGRCCQEATAGLWSQTAPRYEGNNIIILFKIMVSCNVILNSRLVRCKRYGTGMKTEEAGYSKMFKAINHTTDTINKFIFVLFYEFRLCCLLIYELMSLHLI